MRTRRVLAALAFSWAVLCSLQPPLFAQLHSTLLLQHYFSAQLQRTVNYYILLPPGDWVGAPPPGQPNAFERYPVLYMLRGAEWEWITPTQDGSRNGRSLKTIVDDLQSRGKIGRMIYVMPGVSQPGTLSELYALAYEMVPYIDSVYHTLPTRWHRGIDGFSLGGLDEMNLITTRPGAFATSASYDGSFFLFDSSRLNLPPDQAGELGQVRFMHHSGGDPAQTNYDNVLSLVEAMNARGWQNEFADIRLTPDAIHNWWFADQHMLVTLPLHWQTFQHAPQRITAQLVSPVQGSRVSGTVKVQWSVAKQPPHTKVLVDYSDDRGKSWRPLATAPADSSTAFSSYNWNTLSVPDGPWYLLRLHAVQDTAYAFWQMPAPFAIDNPGNGAPVVDLSSPLPGDTISGLTALQWLAADPEGDSISVSIDQSGDGGLTWDTLASGLRSSDPYLWDSRKSPNSTQAMLRVRAFDGHALGEKAFGPFTLMNTRTPVAASAVQHVAGPGDGVVIPHLIDPARVQQHTYEVTFTDSAGKATRLSVRDLTLNALLIAQAPLRRAGNEGPEFHGLRLEVAQPENAQFSPDSTRWLKGASTLRANVTVPEFMVGDSMVRGMAYPADYLLTVYDHVVDTSSSYLGATPVPMRFSVMNLSDRRMPDVVFIDQDGDGQISASDEVVVLEPGPGREPLLAWDLVFTSVGAPVAPQPGDVFFVKIMKPFSARDTVRFTPVFTGIAAAEALQPEQTRLYQNYPNPFNPTTTIRYHLAAAGEVRLTVYDLLGRRVAVLVNERKSPGSYEVRFDGARLSTGVYFCRLEAGGAVEVRRILLLK